MRRTARPFSLFVALAVVWVLLSGHYTPLILTLGALSVALVTWLALRMHLVDLEGQPLQFVPRIFPYWAYLVKEILRANFDVIRRIVDRRLPISPTVAEVAASQHTDAARVVFANSITLTPGTVSLELTEGFIRVHALSREAAQGLISGEMNARVISVERGQ